MTSFPRKRESSVFFGKSLGPRVRGDGCARSAARRAASYAESRLAVAALDLPLHETTDQGASDDGHYAWATKVDPYVPPGTTAEQSQLTQLLPMRLWRLSVTVSWPGEAGNQRSVAISTVRLAMKQP